MWQSRRPVSTVLVATAGTHERWSSRFLHKSWASRSISVCLPEIMSRSRRVTSPWWEGWVVGEDRPWQTLTRVSCACVRPRALHPLTFAGCQMEASVEGSAAHMTAGAAMWWLVSTSGRFEIPHFHHKKCDWRSLRLRKICGLMNTYVLSTSRVDSFSVTRMEFNALATRAGAVALKICDWLVCRGFGFACTCKLYFFFLHVEGSRTCIFVHSI